MGARPRQKVPGRPHKTGPVRSSPQKYMYGQYFSRQDVVDLILGFCIKRSDLNILDPSCGNGIFLRRAFERLKYLNPVAKLPALVGQLWGIELEKSLVLETQRQLNEATKCPPSSDIPGSPSSQIIAADFFDCLDMIDSSIPTNIGRPLPKMGAVVGNPPYTRQEVLGGHTFGKDYKEKLANLIRQEFNTIISARAGIYAYFIFHATKFLDEDPKGRLGFVTLRSWLDVDFGQELKGFLLDHYKIIAIIQSLKEKWFPDAQMIPCVLILAKESNPELREKHVAKFVQLREDLSQIIYSGPNSMHENKVEVDWGKVDNFVRYVEDLPENRYSQSETEEKFQRILVRESNIFRIVAIAQKNLDPATKWGKYLSAPTIYFKILESPFAQELLVPLKTLLSKITPGIKSGANNFFYFPNINFSLGQWTDSHLKIQGKGNQKGSSFTIERKFLGPILVKFKPQRRIFIQTNDCYCLTISQPIRELKENQSLVLEYVRFGEGYPPDEPYSLRRTCQNRISPNLSRNWFQIAPTPPPLLLHFEITTNREVTFYLRPDLRDEILQKQMLVNYGFYQLFPAKEADAEVILALLNSTFGYLMVEFGGRYLENRDGTISNETRIGDLEELPILNPALFRQDQRQKLIDLVRRLGQRPVCKIWEEFEQPDRHALDSVIFAELLGISGNEIQEVYSSLAEIAKTRNMKKERTNR